MRNALKVKVQFGLLFVVLLAVQVYIWNIWELSQFANSNIKIVLGAVVLFLQIPALIMFLSAFFVLDEQGRIPKDSRLYKLLKYFTETMEETEDGQIIHKDNVSEYVRFCLPFWLLFLLVALSAGSIALLILLISFIMNPSMPDFNFGDFGSFSDFKSMALYFVIIMGFVVALGTSLVVLISLLVKIFPWFKNSLFGRLIAAVYDKACVKIPIATK